MVRTVPGSGTVPTVHFVNKTFTLLESIKSLTAKSVIAVFLPKSIAYIYLDNGPRGDGRRRNRHPVSDPVIMVMDGGGDHGGGCCCRG